MPMSMSNAHISSPHTQTDILVQNYMLWTTHGFTAALTHCMLLQSTTVNNMQPTFDDVDENDNDTEDDDRDDSDDDDDVPDVIHENVSALHLNRIHFGI